MESLLSNSSCHSNVTGLPSYYCRDNLTGTLVWTAFSTVIFLLGFPSSVAVMWGLIQEHRTHSRSSTSDIFMFNMTFMDVIFNIFIPFSNLNFFIWFNELFFTFEDFLYSFSMSGRPLFMACIGMDNYLAVVHPITYMNNKSLRYRILLSAGIWGFNVIYSVLFYLDYISFISPLSTIAYCITILIILLCDLPILRALRRSGPGNGDIHPVKQKAIETITNSLILTLLTYLPPVAAYSFRAIMNFTDEEFRCSVAIPVSIVPMSASCVMPILYLRSTGKLQCLWSKQ